MARKRFRLEAVWRVRNLMEAMRKRELGGIQTELVVARGNKRKLLEEMAEEREALEEELRRGVDASKMQLVQAHLRALQDRLVLADLEIADVRKRLAAKREELLAVTKDRKVMDSLREKHIVHTHRYDMIRLSPHFYNTLDEVDEVLKVLK